MVAKKGYLNVHKLSGLNVNKFSDKLEELLKGEYLYRTIDGRVLDFENGTEQAPPKKFSIKHEYARYMERHANRKRKDKDRKRKR